MLQDGWRVLMHPGTFFYIKKKCLIWNNWKHLKFIKYWKSCQSQSWPYRQKSTNIQRNKLIIHNKKNASTLSNNRKYFKWIFMRIINNYRFGFSHSIAAHNFHLASHLTHPKVLHQKHFHEATQKFKFYIITILTFLGGAQQI